MLFLQPDQEVQIPPHHHGNRWGIVIDGAMELTIGKKTATFQQGDSCFLLAGTSHSAILSQGFRALDYFADKDRYKKK